ncbi:MAG: hypothetical protein QNJ70_00965 [Xenococcaceae cyanobacterium MO_207.B15]|nr:hypothetical protein [Xenococcaceae cyanobacterium MO_207.B15]
MTYEIVSDRLTRLQNNIRQDAIEIINDCNSETELDFLFPELTRIQNHDLLILETWEHNLDWMISLSPAEKQMLKSYTAEITTQEQAIIIEDIPPEVVYYQELKAMSHFAALQDNLKLAIQP